MRDRYQTFSSSLLPVLGILIGMAFEQSALADAEEPAARYDATASQAHAVPAPMSGQKVYNEVCIACHAPPGLGGAPALGDSAAWAPRIANGTDTLIDHALTGYSGSTGIMPKKGGRLDLSDEEIVGAVRYMVEQVTQ